MNAQVRVHMLDYLPTMAVERVAGMLLHLLSWGGRQAPSPAAGEPGWWPRLTMATRPGGRDPRPSARRGPSGAARRGLAASPNAPTPPPSFKDLSPRQRGITVGFALLTLVAIVGAALLFVNNVNVVRADAAYKQGQAYEQTGVQCLRQPQACPIPGAQQLSPQQVIVYTGTSILPQAITYYQQALDEQPSQDRYDIDMGRTHLEDAEYYLTVARDPTVAQQAHITAAVAQQNAAQEFATAAATFQRARALNPYNADHPMNLARLYVTWAEQLDPRLWPLADQYYRIGTGPALAAHNGRFSDEWGRADMVQAQQPTLAPARRTALYHQALAAFQHACTVDDLLGDARALRGDAYLALGQYPPAAASYAEALRVSGFEPDQTGVTMGKVVQGLIAALYDAHDYQGLVSPVYGGGKAALYGGASPVALAASPTVTADFSPTFTGTLQSILATLRQKGLAR